MRWDLLKSMKCPKCGGILLRGTGVYTCASLKERCTFTIREKRFDELVSDLYRTGASVRVISS